MDRSNLSELAHSQPAVQVTWGRSRRNAHQAAKSGDYAAIAGGLGWKAGQGVMSLHRAAPEPLQVEQRSCEAHGEYTARLLHVVQIRPPQWTGCPVCREQKAQEHQRAAIAQAQAEARAELAAKRAAAREAAMAEVLGRAKFPKRYANATLEGWRTTDYPEKQAHVLKRAAWYVQTWPERLAGGNSLLFCGSIGTGKTQLAVAIGRAVIAAGSTCVYADMQDITAAIKGTWNWRSAKTSEADVMSYCVEADLLILDEVGRQKDGGLFDQRVLFSIINARSKDMLPTLIISNMTIPEFVQYAGDATADRLREGGKAVEFKWPSLRNKHAGLSGEDW